MKYDTRAQGFTRLEHRHERNVMVSRWTIIIDQSALDRPLLIFVSLQQFYTTHQSTLGTEEIEIQDSLFIASSTGRVFQRILGFVFFGSTSGPGVKGNHISKFSLAHHNNIHRYSAQILSSSPPPFPLLQNVLRGVSMPSLIHILLCMSLKLTYPCPSPLPPAVVF